MNTDTPTPRTNKAFLDGYTFCKEDMMPAVAFASQLERKLTAVTEQRDRLAEALERILPFVDPIIGNVRYTQAQQALAAVEGGSNE
jgi:hypothetical protein